MHQLSRPVPESELSYPIVATCDQRVTSIQARVLGLARLRPEGSADWCLFEDVACVWIAGWVLRERVGDP
jgi:hypothetical protein